MVELYISIEEEELKVEERILINADAEKDINVFFKPKNVALAK